MKVPKKVLDRVAKGLGWTKLARDRHGFWHVARDVPEAVAEGEHLTDGRRVGMDGELFFAILEEAAKQGGIPVLSEDPSWSPDMPYHQWNVQLVNDLAASPVTYFKGNGRTPLEALMLAFAESIHRKNK